MTEPTVPLAVGERRQIEFAAAESIRLATILFYTLLSKIPT